MPQFSFISTSETLFLTSYTQELNRERECSKTHILVQLQCCWLFSESQLHSYFSQLTFGAANEERSYLSRH